MHTALLEKFKNGSITINEKKQLQQILKVAYYTTGSPLITDEEYDSMFDLNNESIGYDLTKSQYNIVKHTYPMGSLKKIKTFEDGLAYMNNHKDVIVQPKLDGLSLALYYNKGTLVNAVLRGSGDKGEDIYTNAINFSGVLKQINDESVVFVRGEIVISKSSFSKLPNDLYSNRRNAVSGIARRYDGEYTSLLSFKSYDIACDNDSIKTEQDKLMKLYNLGFSLPFAITEFNADIYKKYADLRLDIEDYQMDGLVLKVNDMSDQIALKFPPEGAETTITGYEWNLGTTGALIPKVLFDTVDLQGAKMSKAAMGSYNAVVEMNAGKGSKVIVKRMGDVIPKVVSVLTYGDELELPTNCPICNEKLIIDGAHIYCKNLQCPQKLKISCATVFNAFNLKGITPTFIHKLIDNNSMHDFSEVVLLSPEMISDNSKISIERAFNVVSLMHNKLKNEFSYIMFLRMLNIQGISGKAIDKIANSISINDLLKVPSVEECIKILGNSKGTSLHDYLIDNIKSVTNLLININKIIIGNIVLMHK